LSFVKRSNLHIIAFSLGFARGSSDEIVSARNVNANQLSDRTRPDELNLRIRQVLEPPSCLINRNPHWSAMFMVELGGEICQGADFTDGRG